jgi:gamma-glutamyl-gamma-aminobutyrate hydrolase PuuD
MLGAPKGCQEVLAVVGGTLYRCHVEVVPGTDRCHHHQSEKQQGDQVNESASSPYRP